MNAEADKKKKEEVETRNQAEALVHSTEKTLKENGDKISASDKSAIEDAIQGVKTALEGTDTAAIKEKSDALMQASLKLGEAMYKAQGAAANASAGEAQGTSTGEEAKADEKVVDADFEEVK